MGESRVVSAGGSSWGGGCVGEKGKRIYDLVLGGASGGGSKAEAQGLGGDEFVPWQIGAVM